MIPYKKGVLLLCIYIAIWVGVSRAQVYSEFENKKKCHIPITLDIPDIDVPAFIWAIFDYDPMPGYRERILEHIAHWYPSQMNALTDPEKSRKFRNAVIEGTWADGFEFLSGSEVCLYRKAKDVDNWYNTYEDGNYWFVTQSILHKKKPICWCIPIRIKPGTKIELILTKKNAIYLGDLFDEIMAEAPPPRTHGLYSDMIKVLHNAQTLYYETDITLKYDDYFHESKYKVWLKKPNHARIESYFKDELYGTMVGDGENFWFFWTRDRPYRSSDDSLYYEATKTNSYLRLNARPGFHSIWHVVNRTGSGMMVFQPSIFHKCHNAFDENIDTVMVNENEMVGDVLCNYIEVSYLDQQRSRYYWLGQDDHLPRKLKDITRVRTDIITEELWSNITMNIDMPDSLFQWEPPEGWTELAEHSMESRLLPVGTPAPDFSFETLDGGTFTLSECKGKVVLINFWRVGCPPCREELPWLEEMHQKFKDQGLIVVGYNTSDDEQFVRKLLEEHNITYPNIYTTSEEAQTVQFEQYQKAGASGVPLNYVIDSEGNVAMTWYGFDKGKEKRIERLLTD